MIWSGGHSEATPRTTLVPVVAANGAAASAAPVRSSAMITNSVMIPHPIPLVVRTASRGEWLRLASRFRRQDGGLADRLLGQGERHDEAREQEEPRDDECAVVA